MRRPDPIALQRLDALTSGVAAPVAAPVSPAARAAPVVRAGSASPPEGGWFSEPWDLDAWPDVPPSLDAWPVRRLAPVAELPAAAPPQVATPVATPVAGSAAVELLAADPVVPELVVPEAAAPAWAPPPGLVEHARAALVARLPAPLRAGRFDPGRRGAYVVGALGLLAAVAAVAFAVHGRAEVVATGVRSGVSSSAAAPAAVAAAGVDPISGGVTVEVDVEGRVLRPGLVSLPSGSRVADALQKAGGVLPGTRTESLDLAAKVTDGQQLVVGLTAATAAAAAPAATGPGGVAAGALVDLNTATAAQLDALPHVGPVTAAKIIAWRTAHGPFAAVTDLQQVAGIGPSTYQDIAPLVSV